jgi:hypothetical protein
VATFSFAATDAENIFDLDPLQPRRSAPRFAAWLAAMKKSLSVRNSHARCGDGRKRLPCAILAFRNSRASSMLARNGGASSQPSRIELEVRRRICFTLGA